MSSRKYFLKSTTPSYGRRTVYKSSLALRRDRYRAMRQAAARKANTGSALAMVNKRTGGYEDMENKFIDGEREESNISASWAGSELDPFTPVNSLALSAVAQGDGESQRDGRVYYINSCHLKGYLSRDPVAGGAAPSADMLVRLVLYWDTQTNSAQSQGEEVMLPVGGGDDIQSFRNLQNSKRFIVLKDKTYRVPASMANVGDSTTATFSQGKILIPFSMNKKFKKPIKVRCTGTTQNVSSISDNSLHLIGVCSTGNGAQISYVSRVRFSG